MGSKGAMALKSHKTAYSRQIEHQVELAVAGIVAEGLKPSFYAVAKRADVAKSTLYRCPNLKKIVCDARDAFDAKRQEPSAFEQLVRENEQLRRRVRELEEMLRGERCSHSRVAYWIVNMDFAS